MPGSKGKINKHSPSRYLHKCKLVAKFDLRSRVKFVNLEFPGRDFHVIFYRIFRVAYCIEGIFLFD